MKHDAVLNDLWRTRLKQCTSAALCKVRIHRVYDKPNSALWRLCKNDFALYRPFRAPYTHKLRYNNATVRQTPNKLYFFSVLSLNR
jgi:hypothetical protein